jgi:hypothetical protein
MTRRLSSHAGSGIRLIVAVLQLFATSRSLCILFFGWGHPFILGARDKYAICGENSGSNTSNLERQDAMDVERVPQRYIAVYMVLFHVLVEIDVGGPGRQSGVGFDGRE